MILHRITNKLGRGLRAARKGLYRATSSFEGAQQVVFIVGCQRSGTTLMLDLFDADLRTKTYGEFSRLSSQDRRKGIRLNPLAAVSEEVRRQRAPLIVLKPLVESQHVLRLLDYFEGSRALWMYRHYADVAQSNLDHFGLRNGINDLRYIAKDDPDDWRAEAVPADVRQVVARHFSETMDPYDAAVLFWLVRNSLFFHFGLDEDPRVLMCRYEDLVVCPAAVMRGLYDTLGQRYPGDGIVAGVHARSLHKHERLALSPTVKEHALQLMARLDVTYRRRQAAEPVRNSG